MNNARDHSSLSCRIVALVRWSSHSLNTLMLLSCAAPGALCDMKSDASVGKHTIATFVGKQRTLQLLMAVWFVEGATLGLVFGEGWACVVYLVLGLGLVTGRLRIHHMYQLTGGVCTALLLKRWYFLES